MPTNQPQSPPKPSRPPGGPTSPPPPRKPSGYPRWASQPITESELIEATNQASVAFTIPGPPVGKGRPRASTINGMARMYTPKKTASYETLVVMAYQQAGGAKLQGSLEMHITATFAMPLSWSTKKRRAMDGAFCQKKPDSDNILKIVADALNGVAYHDDASIVVASVKKRWGQDGSVSVDLLTAAGPADQQPH